jgi:regulator of sigma D
LSGCCFILEVLRGHQAAAPLLGKRDHHAGKLSECSGTLGWGAQADRQQDFCGVLVDYVSAGHFGVYEQLTKEAEAFDDQRGLDLAETIYPRIDVITEKLLAFTDLCDAGKCVAEKFKELGGLLHERFELEDCLIEVLHNAHKEEAATQA